MSSEEKNWKTLSEEVEKSFSRKYEETRFFISKHAYDLIAKTLKMLYPNQVNKTDNKP